LPKKCSLTGFHGSRVWARHLLAPRQVSHAEQNLFLNPKSHMDCVTKIRPDETAKKQKSNRLATILEKARHPVQKNPLSPSNRLAFSKPFGNRS